ncbi:Rv3235 family protein [Amycolatopsis azurea]|uniref:Rv3235 family protein n=1 Tax=Amycolatopsis azurea TaxID=36819 RepID=UPI00381202EC
MERIYPQIQRKEYAPQSQETLQSVKEWDPYSTGVELVSRQERYHASLVLIGLVEVFNGQRSLRQLEQHLSVPLYSDLSKRCSGSATNEAHSLRTLHLQKPRPEVIEANGTVVTSIRARAIVARFHHYRRGWLCVSVEVI